MTTDLKLEDLDRWEREYADESRRLSWAPWYFVGCVLVGVFGLYALGRLFLDAPIATTVVIVILSVIVNAPEAIAQLLDELRDDARRRW